MNIFITNFYIFIVHQNNIFLKMNFISFLFINILHFFLTIFVILKFFNISILRYIRYILGIIIG